MGPADFLKARVRQGQKIAVLGIGSALRSDDAAGMYLIELLRNRVKKENVLLIAGSTAPENFTGVIKKFGPDQLLVVDAAYMGLQPGEAKVVPAADISGLSFSTHMLPLSVMLGYLEKEIKCDVACIGIQPRYVDQGLPMSEAVKEGTERLAEDLCEILMMV